MGDQDKSLIDQAKDALGMGDDDKNEHAEHGDRRTTGADTERTEGWGSDTDARATGTGGTAGTTGSTGTGAGSTGATGTGGTAGSDESILRDEDTVDSTRRETGV